MAASTDIMPPVPSQTPISDPDPKDKVYNPKYFGIGWTQWFVQVKAKIDVIDASIVGLANVTGTGLTIHTNTGWVTRSIEGTSGQVSVTNGSGVSGNPKAGLVATGVSAGSYTNTNLTVDEFGRITDAEDGSGGGGGDNPLTTVRIFTDCLDLVPTPTSSGWYLVSNSSGGQSNVDSEDGRPGIWRMTTSTSSGARRAFRYGYTGSVLLTDADSTTNIGFRVSDISTAVNDFYLMVGFADADTMGASTSVFGLAISQSIHATNIQLYRQKAGVPEYFDTGIAYAANTWLDCEIKISDAGATCDVDINGEIFHIEASPGDTVVPVGNMAPYMYFLKQAGTSARTADIDYFEYTKTLSTRG